MNEQVSEKSRLQTEALKNMEAVMASQTEISELKLQLKEVELQGNGDNSGSGHVDHEKEGLYTALAKSNMELQTQKLTKTFEEKERALNTELAKLKDQVSAKTKAQKQIENELTQKQTDMKEMEQSHKINMDYVQTMERSNRQKLINSHKNESRTMAAILHDVSAKLAFS